MVSINIIIQDSIPLDKLDEEKVKNASTPTKFPKMQMRNMGYYEGEWLHGQRHGFGVYVIDNFKFRLGQTIQFMKDNTLKIYSMERVN